MQIYNVVKTELKSIFDFFGQNAGNKAESFITFFETSGMTEKCLVPTLNTNFGQVFSFSWPHYECH